MPEVQSRTYANPRRLRRRQCRRDRVRQHYNYHRLHGELDWQTPAERFDGTPFIDRGFASVPALSGIADLLDAILLT